MARRACREGGWAAFLVAGITGFLTVLAVAGVKFARDMGVDAYSAIDVVVFAAIGFGLFRCSRVAAVAGLSLYVLERIASPPTNVTGILLGLLFIGYFCGAVRGAFAHHRLRKTPTAVPA